MSGPVPEQVGADAEQAVTAAEPEAVADGGLAASTFGVGGPSGVGGLRRLPPRQRAQAIARLNAGGGNAAVAQMIQRWADGPPQQQDPGSKVKIDIDKASEPEKIAEIQRLMSYSGIAAIDGIQRIWYSFGDLKAVAGAHPDLFLKSAEKLPKLVKDDRFDPIRQDFKNAVDAKVSANLEANRNYVLEEMKKLGISGDEKQDADKAPSPEEDKKLREVQLLAEQASKAQKAKAALKLITVGKKEGMARPSNDINPPKVTVKYEPGSPPSNLTVVNEPGMRPWADVDKEYRTAEAALQKILASNPAVYALVSQADEGSGPEQQGEAAKKASAANPADARNQIRPAMVGVLNKIEDAAGKVGSDLDYRDFIPVHDQLMQTSKFSGPIERAVIKVDVEGHETMKMLRSLGLGALSAAAFILAEFATGGMATFLLVAGLAATAGNAALSIDDYMNKRTAANAKSGDPRLDIVSDSQADSALITAVIDSVFVFIDGAGVVIGALSTSAKAARGLLAAAEAGAAEAATKGLVEALAHGGEAATKAIEKSVTEVGIEGTMKASGKSAQELAAQVGEKTPLGERILAAGKLGAEEGGKGLEELAAKLAKFKDITDAAEKEQVLKQALDQFGVMGTSRKVGGWKAMTKGLATEGGTAKQLMEWRESLVRQLEDYIAKESEGASKTVQTGTQRQATSDVDVSTFGKDASQNVAKSKEFLAARAGCDSKELEPLLDLEVMADPTRMHLQDVTQGLTDDARRDISRSAAKYEEQLIFARRIYEARQAGNEALAQQAMKDAEALGIKPFEGYKPLSKGEIDALNARLDGLIEKMKTASEAEKKQLIEEIGQTQGQILAENPMAYSTGGGIRVNVTTRDIDKARMPAVTTPLWPESRYTAILAEGPHMDSAASKLALEGQTPAAYADAIKNLGKHGNRVAKSLGTDVVAVTGEQLDKLANDLATFAENAKKPEFIGNLANQQELQRIRQEIAKSLTDLKAAQDQGLKALRDQAQLGQAMAPEAAGQIQAWTSATAKFEQAIDAAQRAAPTVFEAIHQGASAAVPPGGPDKQPNPADAPPTGREDEDKKASIPDAQQNSSQAPQPAGV